jgi:hypothetical protein
VLGAYCLIDKGQPICRGAQDRIWGHLERPSWSCRAAQYHAAAFRGAAGAVWGPALDAPIAALGTAVQGWTAYHDWACKTGWWTFTACPPNLVSGFLSPPPTGSSQLNPQPQLNNDHYR